MKELVEMSGRNWKRWNRMLESVGLPREFRALIHARGDLGKEFIREVSVEVSVVGHLFTASPMVANRVWQLAETTPAAADKFCKAAVKSGERSGSCQEVSGSCRQLLGSYRERL